jgi:DNA-binding transcriptional MerR regulator
MSKVLCEHPLTLGELAIKVGIGEGRLRRLFANGTLAEPVRFMGKRVFHEGDVEKIKSALRERGVALEEVPHGSHQTALGEEKL